MAADITGAADYKNAHTRKDKRSEKTRAQQKKHAGYKSGTAGSRISLSFLLTARLFLAPEIAASA